MGAQHSNEKDQKSKPGGKNKKNQSQKTRDASADSVLQSRTNKVETNGRSALNSSNKFESTIRENRRDVSVDSVLATSKIEVNNGRESQLESNAALLKNQQLMGNNYVNQFLGKTETEDLLSNSL